MAFNHFLANIAVWYLVRQLLSEAHLNSSNTDAFGAGQPNQQSQSISIWWVKNENLEINYLTNRSFNYSF